MAKCVKICSFLGVAWQGSNGMFVYLCVRVFVCKWAQTSPAQSGLHQTAAGHFPPTSLTVPLAVGLGGGEDGFYLSPRMAYWLSNCRCCKEAWPSPSLTRLLCLTTSKVVSISLSLQQKSTSIQDWLCSKWNTSNCIVCIYFKPGGLKLLEVQQWTLLTSWVLDNYIPKTWVDGFCQTRVSAG